MALFEATRGSIFSILRALTERAKELVRKEIQLAKTEVSEKVSKITKDAAQFAIAGVVAYTGLLVFVIGLGYLAAWGLISAGIQPMLSAFIGLSSVGLLIILVGAGLFFKAKSGFSKRNVQPERTIKTLEQLKDELSKPGLQTALKRTETRSSQPGSPQLQSEAEKAQAQMGQALNELGRRLSPHEMNERVKHRIQSEPYSAGVFAMVAGLVSGLLVRRRSRRA